MMKKKSPKLRNSNLSFPMHPRRNSTEKKEVVIQKKKKRRRRYKRKSSNPSSQMLLRFVPLLHFSVASMSFSHTLSES